MQLIEEFKIYLESILRELQDWLLGYKINFRDFGVTVRSNLRVRNLLKIIDSMIFAIENGKLCEINRFDNGAIHPDAYNIISSESVQPRDDINDAIKSYREFLNGLGDINISGFEDPMDPALAGSIPVDRAHQGESLAETIARYQTNCQAFLAGGSVPNPVPTI